MEYPTSALTFCKANESDFESLVRCIAKVLIDGNSMHAHTYTMDKWLWKYFRMPHAEPRIYICKQGQEILGYYHCAVYRGVLDGELVKIAMVQDVGMSEVARGKGVFSKLAVYATNDLLHSDIQFSYTFPNEKSIHTFIKYNGYDSIDVLMSFVIPIQFDLILASKFKFFGLEKRMGQLLNRLFSLFIPKVDHRIRVTQSEVLTEQMIDVFLDFNKRFANTLIRDENYLKWRYVDKPQGKYYFFCAYEGTELNAVAIISIEDLLGVKAAVIMDFAIREAQEAAFVQMIVQIRNNDSVFFNESIGLLYSSTIRTNEFVFKKAGFIKIPQRWNPRPLNLLGRSLKSKVKTSMDPLKWNITLSDWDVL